MSNTTHGTGWRADASGWSTLPGYCWCGRLARECPEPKIDVTAADMERAIDTAYADMQAAKTRYETAGAVYERLRAWMSHSRSCRCDNCQHDAMTEHASQQW